MVTSPRGSPGPSDPRRGVVPWHSEWNTSGASASESHSKNSFSQSAKRHHAKRLHFRLRLGSVLGLHKKGLEQTASVEPRTVEPRERERGNCKQRAKSAVLTNFNKLIANNDSPPQGASTLREHEEPSQPPSPRGTAQQRVEHNPVLTSCVQESATPVKK